MSFSTAITSVVQQIARDIRDLRASLSGTISKANGADTRSRANETKANNNASAISTNASNISTNASNISTNAANIAAQKYGTGPTKTITDWNDATENGTVVMASGAANAPTSDWYIGTFWKHNSIYGKQEVSTFTFDTPRVYRRVLKNGVWMPWQEVPSLEGGKVTRVFADVAELQSVIDAGFNPADGTTVTINGKTLVRDRDFSSQPKGLPVGWRYTWMRQKHLVTADLQPKPAELSGGVSEVPRMQAVFDNIADMHPDIYMAHVLGDIIHEGSVDGAGADPAYTYADFLADWNSRMPVPFSRSYFIAGNHDRDGTGYGQSENAWSTRTYRSFFGPEFYYTVQGNLMNIYMGDMGGSTGGTITDAVVAWCRTICLANKDKNIIWNIHQPIGGCYTDTAQTDTNNPSTYQSGSVRLQELLNEIGADADNIAAVFYGHVGSANQFYSRNRFYTYHYQIGMHIPSNVDNNRNDQFYIFDLRHGDSVCRIEQWDATAKTYLSYKNVYFKYPLQLGEELSFDGRSQTDVNGLRQSPQTVEVALSDWRYHNGSSWVNNTYIPVAEYYLSNVGNDGIDEDLGMNMEFYFPQKVTRNQPNSSTTDWDDRSTRGSEKAGLIRLQRKGGTDASPDTQWMFRSRLNGQVSTTFKIEPDGKIIAPGGGVFVGNVDARGNVLATGQVIADNNVETKNQLITQNGMTSQGSLRVFGSGYFGYNGTGTSSPGSSDTGQVGVVVANSGFLSAYRHSDVVGLFGRGTDGAIFNFYKSGSYKGGVKVDSNGVEFRTSSDERLKEDLRDFDGLQMIRDLGVWDHAWKSNGARSYSVMAQQAYTVIPQAVSVGGDDVAEDPWGVDYSKLVAPLIKAVQQLDDKVKHLEALLDERTNAT